MLNSLLCSVVMFKIVVILYYSKLYPTIKINWNKQFPVNPKDVILKILNTVIFIVFTKHKIQV